MASTLNVHQLSADALYNPEARDQRRKANRGDLAYVNGKIVRVAEDGTTKELQLNRPGGDDNDESDDDDDVEDEDDDEDGDADGDEDEESSEDDDFSDLDLKTGVRSETAI